MIQWLCFQSVQWLVEENRVLNAVLLKITPQNCRFEFVSTTFSLENGVLQAV